MTSLLQWNLRGFQARRPHLQHLIDELCPDVLSLHETYLKPHHSARLSQFQPPLRFDRTDRFGGGVALFFRQTLPTFPLPLASPLEAVAARLFLPTLTFTVCSLYLPPHLPTATLSDTLPSLVQSLPAPYLIMVDANAHHPLWGSSHTDSRGRLLASWIEDDALVVLNDGKPTYLSPSGSYSHIDLTICTPSLASTFFWQPHFDPTTSDHFPLIISTNCNSVTAFSNSRWNLKAANWSLFQTSLHLPTSFYSPTQACGSVTSAILSAASASIPLCSSSPPRRCAVWWTKECAIARRLQRRALSRYNNHKGTLSLWLSYKRAQAHFRYVVRQAKRSSWATFLATFTSRTSSAIVWRHVRLLRSVPSSRTIVLQDWDSFLTSPQDVANSLARYFSSRSSGLSADPQFALHKALEESSAVEFPVDTSASYNSPFTMAELAHALRSAVSRTPGPDSIPYSFFHHFTPSHLAHLLAFYNYIFQTGYPHQWREGHILPLPKPGKVPSLTSSYRPITLLNCLSKLYEKLLTRRLQSFLETQRFYTPIQSGFRASHSTLDGLSRLEHAARSALLEGHFCLAVFLDISQAFDTVWHHGLLCKLSALGLAGHLATTIQQFLLSRRIRVRYASTLSDTYPLHCGVPQGSVLSPTLFTVLINDLFHSVHPPVHTSLYADDGALWTTSPTLLGAVQQMQAALDAVSAWSHTWGLSISAAKTSAMFFTLRQLGHPPSLFLQGSEIPYVSEARFLGLYWSPRLTWHSHIVRLRDRCRQDLNLMRVVAACRWGSDLPTLRRLYVSLIRSKLDYASFLFHTASTSTLAHLDRIQYAAIRIMLGALRCTPTYMLEAEADLMPLALRRRKLLAQYGSRVLCVADHPVSSMFYTDATTHLNLSTSYCLSALSRLHAEFTLLSIAPTSLPTIALSFHYRYRSLPVLSSLSLHSKSQLSPSQWQALFHDLHHTRYKQHFNWYTDGSRQEDSCACAVWSAHCSAVAHLPATTTIYTAELYAIYCCLKLLLRYPGPHVVFTDSLSAIRALQTLDSTSHYLLSWIASLLLTNNNITLEWVPSHVGILGNERADALATSAHRLSYITAIPPSSSELRTCISATYLAEWTRHWASLPAPATAFKPHLGPPAFSTVPRPHQVCLTRLRLGVSRLTHQHFYSASPPTLCTHCQVCLTPAHLFLHCPGLRHSRVALQQACHALNKPYTLPVLLSGQIPAEELICFLQHCDALGLL